MPGRENKIRLMNRDDLRMGISAGMPGREKVRFMYRENLRIIGIVIMVVALAILIIFFDDIKAIFNEAMAEQADSLVDQLLR